MSGDPTRPTAYFRPDVFEVATLAQAMKITVTQEEGTTSRERWEKETGFLLDDISKYLAIDSNSCVLDYGCGDATFLAMVHDLFPLATDATIDTGGLADIDGRLHFQEQREDRPHLELGHFLRQNFGQRTCGGHRQNLPAHTPDGSPAPRQQ